MTAVAVRDAAAAPRTWADRLLAALPLTLLFLGLCILYGWQASAHPTPWLFSDELEFAQLSRAIAETGRAARRGDPHSFNSLYTYLTAPAWLISDTSTAYATAKYVGVAVMSAVVFPAYALARLLVARPAALFAAAGAGAVPSLAYSSMMLSEPLAYPYAALCFLAIAKALLARTRGWIALAVLLSLVAPLVRGQLALVPAVAVGATAVLWWTGARARAWRARWSRGDWLGAAVLVVLAAILFGAIMSSGSYSWLVATRYYKGRMLEYGLWAFGALAIGLGVLPFVAGIAALFRRRADETPAFRVFAAIAWTALFAFGLYTAVKAAYVSTVFATLIEERNLIYLAPIFFVATALWLERPRLHLAGLAAATGFAATVLVSTPYQLDRHLYSDALGLAILEMLNRTVALDDAGATWLLVGMLLLTVALLLAPRLLARRVPRAAVAVLLGAVATLAVAWNLAGEVSAASASNSFSEDFLANLPPQLDWVDQTTGGEPALYLGQQITDPNGLWQLEFWNRSLKRVWSLDGTAPGPGPTLTPDLAKPNGTLSPQLGYRFVVADTGVDPYGTLVRKETHYRLYRVPQPFRLASSVTGLYEDGWSRDRVAYSRYHTPSERAGWVVVTLSRKAWCGPDKPATAAIRVGTVGIGEDKQPTIGRVTQTRRTTIHACGYEQLAIPAPKPPFRVEVTFDPTFSPHELDPAQSDARQLGAGVDFAFANAKPKL